MRKEQMATAMPIELPLPAPLALVPGEVPFKIPGYRITARIHQSGRADIYRGVRECDDQRVVLKTLHGHALTPENIACYRHEYQMLQRLQSAGVVRAYDFKQDHSVVALIIEDFGGKALKEWIGKSQPTLGLDRQLALALKLVAALRDVHSADIIHKDLNPNNIVVNAATGELKLIDFGLATPLQREQATTAIPTMLLGTLAYIAPEQTGRMNRAVDYRSDFYSLGATLYEFFTGQPPFTGQDALELIHAHIARQPTPPHVVNSKVPEPVSAIIMKLLAKTAEERYQSIWSVETDLENCLKQWRSSGTVEPFPIDRSKVRDRFQLPQKLYGRDRELAMLLTAFESASNGAAEILFVTGHSGIGKTSLVREVYRPITAKRGYLAAGKFDQFQRNVPYSAVLAALGELVRQLLSENEDRIGQWRSSLQEALGSNAGVLTDFLPDLALIIGEQPAIAALNPLETQERLFAVLRKFLGAVCRREHPLVLCFDDLQWADSASLGLLLHILMDRNLEFFLLIASYRDNEVDAGHPVMLAREQLQKRGVTVSEILLTPLDVTHVEQLIGDAFDVGAKETAALAKLVHAKTRGNPYFVDEFLKSLHANGLLHFDAANRGWRWNLETIQTQSVTDNVVEFMARNIRELKPEAQRLLQLGACVGNTFDAQTLAVVAEQSPEHSVQLLQQAILRGLIMPVEQAYHWAAVSAARGDNAHFRFAHDRVQQAAYGLIPERERARVHYRIGRLLQGSYDAAELEKNLFQVVNHLNAGRAEATSDEHEPLAKLNLAAGRRAKATAVYDAAAGYFKTGIELLDTHAWERHYELALALHTEAVQTAALSNDYAELNLRFETVCAHARTPLDQMPVYEAKLDAENRRADSRAATETGLEALRLLGVRFPKKPNRLHMLYYVARARVAMFGRTPESLLDHPRMTDPHRIAESRILRLLCHVFYASSRERLILTLYRFVYLCVKYGNSDTSPSMYTSYAMTLCAGLDIDKGYRFGQLALALVEKLDAKERRSLVSVLVHGTVDHWKKPCRESLALLLDVYRESLDRGDIESAALALLYLGYQSFHVGEALQPLLKTLRDNIEALGKTINDKRNQGILEIYRDAVLLLTNSAEYNNCFSTAPEHQEAAKITEKKHPLTFHFFKAFMAFHFGDAASAHAHMQLCRKYAYTVVGIVRFADLYHGLAAVAVHPTLGKRQQKENRAALLRIKDRLKLFAKHAPDNYLHRWHLLEAEFARLEGKDSVAGAHYDQAIDAAKSSGHIHEEALANELAGRHFLAKNKGKLAQLYLSEARALYVRWGATRKVQWLDETYPQLQLAAAPKATSIGGTVGTAAIATMSLDLPALMKALKAIAEETVHSQILHRTIEIVMQFAGADKALLLLRSDEELRVEADMDTSREGVELLKSVSIQNSTRLCQAVVNYAKRTKACVVIHDAQEPQSVVPGLQNDAYIRGNRVRSILCIPITAGARQDAEVIGLLYVENNQSPYAFTEQRVETLEIICLSVAGRLELSRKAITDSLTGLYNRGYFQSTLTKELSLARRKERPLSLVMIDIDHFKKVNDEWGHQVGDEVIKHVARAIRETCRETDVVARYGGEEMVVILTETSTEQATVVAQRIRQTLEEHPLTLNDRVVKATASLGVATNDTQRNEPETLIKAADEALYRSKANGRNRVTVA
jgi:histidine kinase